MSLYTTYSCCSEFGGEDGDLEFNAAQEFQYDGDTSLYEDEETQQFYEKLLDLRAIIPQILLKDTPVIEDESDGGEKETDKSMCIMIIHHKMIYTLLCVLILYS